MKKAPGYELYVTSSNAKGKFLTSAGIYYTNFKPRIDSFPITVRFSDGNGTLIMPGSFVWRKYNIVGLYVDENVRICHVKDFGLYGGAGFMIASDESSYVRTVPGVIAQDVQTGDYVKAIRLHLRADYTLKNKMKIYVEAMHHRMSTFDGAGQMPTNNISIGFTYFFKAINNEEAVPITRFRPGPGRM